MGCVPGYLDGEPAKAVLEVQGSLVFAEGDGMFGVQPLKLLLVVDHENLPEDTLVRLQENTSGGGRGGAGGGHVAVLGLVISGKGVCMLPSSVPPDGRRNVLIPIAFQSSS